MNLILIGCEYSGTTTLGVAIEAWAREAMGIHLHLHDHWKLPRCSGHPPFETITNLTEEEQQQVLGLTPKVKELYTRYTLYYHTPSSVTPSGPGGIMAGYYIDELVYAPRYFGYGGPGEPGDRRVEAQSVEERILEFVPHTVLVFLTAPRDVIVQRMREHPHPSSTLREQDILDLQQRYEEEFIRSKIRNKLRFDTGTATVEETVAQFAHEIEPYLTEGDRLRMLTKTL